MAPKHQHHQPHPRSRPPTRRHSIPGREPNRAELAALFHFLPAAGRIITLTKTQAHNGEKLNPDDKPYAHRGEEVSAPGGREIICELENVSELFCWMPGVTFFPGSYCCAGRNYVIDLTRKFLPFPLCSLYTNTYTHTHGHS